LGYTNDPTELLLFEEEPLTGVLTCAAGPYERIPTRGDRNRGPDHTL
jgi:hypothetical protein